MLYVYLLAYFSVCHVLSLFWDFLNSFSFSTLLVGSLTCKSRLAYNLYCVGGDVKHYSIQCNPVLKPSKSVFENWTAGNEFSVLEFWGWFGTVFIKPISDIFHQIPHTHNQLVITSFSWYNPNKSHPAKVPYLCYMQSLFIVLCSYITFCAWM